MALDDAADDVGQVGLRIDAVEFGGLDQRGEDRPVVSTSSRRTCSGLGSSVGSKLDMKRSTNRLLAQQQKLTPARKTAFRNQKTTRSIRVRSTNSFRQRLSVRAKNKLAAQPVADIARRRHDTA